MDDRLTRYNTAPKFLGKNRTRFDLSHNILTTFNTGDLVPILCEPIVPGSTFSLKTASLTRLETSFHQTMDNAYLEFAYFFVPSRQLWSHFDQFQGFNSDAWARSTTYQKPQLNLAYDQGITPGVNDKIHPMSLLNYLYAPVSDLPDARGSYISVDALPLRAVFKIYNEYFRDENIDSEIAWSDGDNDIFASDSFLFNGAPFYPTQDSLKVNRFKDVFSTAHPQPQKGAAVQLLEGLKAPVGTIPTNSGTTSGTVYGSIGSGVSFSSGVFQPLKISGSETGLSSKGVVADLSQVDFTVNDLRIAIALQAMRERDSISGTRLNEKLYGTWHIDANMLELDKPEFLGGKRIPINMMEVLQTSETGTTVLGSDAGHSKTFDSDDSFVRTFTQWGYVIGFCFVRTSRSYSQGIDRKFFVKDLLDEYDPMLDAIGEMPVFKKELQACYEPLYNEKSHMDSVFGYQEAWYWYKSRLSRFSGYFQPGISGTLDSWHYGDDYRQLIITQQGNAYVNAAPQLSPEWLKEDPSRVDRTIAVTSGATNSFQWSINIHFEATNTFEAAYRSTPNKFGF